MESVAQLCKFLIKKVLIVGQTMDKTVQVKECRTVTHQKVKFAQLQMYLSASQEITKHAFKIWDTFATIPMTTQVVT